MKRLFILVVTLLMVFSTAACSNPQGNEKAGQEETGQTEQLGQQEQAGQSETSGDVDGSHRTVCESFAAFKDARDEFDDYVLNQDYEIVNVNFPVVSVFDANIFDYVLPLDFIGRSIETSGKFNAGMETQMLRQVWADDAN